MEWQHPIFQEMMKQGCTNQMQMITAYQTYMNLCEVDKLRDVQISYNKELNLISFSSADKSSVMLYIPIAEKDLTPAILHTTRTSLLEKHPNANVTILLKMPDSSLLQYKITEGLTTPPTPEYTKEKKAHQEKVQYIKSELNKRRVALFEEAKQRQIQQAEGEVSLDATNECEVEAKRRKTQEEDVGDSMDKNDATSECEPNEIQVEAKRRKTLQEDVGDSLDKNDATSECEPNEIQVEAKQRKTLQEDVGDSLDKNDATSE